MARFEIGEHDFLLDGQPHRIISGALHYFRVHPGQWGDRIHKARLMGLNAIETYVAWNFHSPEPGRFDTDGPRDLGRFLDLVAAEGLHAIVRPGPYICAEWDNGGLPAWLFRDERVGVRRREPRYLAAVTEYLERVYEIVAPRQVESGGPVIMVQIENEYGAYGTDTQYLTDLVRITREAGIVVPLNTVDQPDDRMLANGSVPGAHATASFGSRAAERLGTLRAHQPTGPLMCMEFWDGWFDSWGTHHHTTEPAATVHDLEALLSAGASVNFYMFHGGTNFGLTNGANDKGRYAPITTSYDYDAPLDEAGNPTDKYFAFRDVIARFAPVPDEAPACRQPAPELSVPLDERSNLLTLADALGPQSHHDTLPTFDALGHDRGVALFTTTLQGRGPGVLSFQEVRDRAWVYLDGAPVGVLAREAHEQAIVLPRGAGELVILVEDQGRVDYGPRIGEHKGLIGGGRLDGEPLVGWDARPIDLDKLLTLELDHDDLAVGPVIARGAFELTEAGDLFLDTAGWGKGFAWVNGFALGRYWRSGPQRTLYVPAPVTRLGRNELVVLELEVLSRPAAVFVPEPMLGHEEP
jgi:beta-galactosidase